MTTTKSEAELVRTFWEKLSASPFVMIGLHSEPEHSEPMTAFHDSEIPNALFIFARQDNRAAKGGAQPCQAMLQFVAKGHDFFACLRGTLTTTQDRALIDRFWRESVGSWFKGGKEDPDLRLLRVDLQDAELWEVSRDLTARVKALFGKVERSVVDGAHAKVNL